MVDMLTLVLVGASATRQVAAGGRAWTYTPRGYEKKRDERLSPLVGRDAGEAGEGQRCAPHPSLRSRHLPRKGRRDDERRPLHRRGAGRAGPDHRARAAG